MTLVELATAVFETAETMDVPHIAAGAYGIPRATKDINLLVSVDQSLGIHQLMDGLGKIVEFDRQTQFDTITWGRRYVGTSRSAPPFKVELFEMFDDAFVRSEFLRRRRTYVPILGREVWLPAPEDVIVQKIRWGRSKDLDDARDVLAVQGPESLDMAYIRGWCETHGTARRLEDLLESLPPL